MIFENNCLQIFKYVKVSWVLVFFASLCSTLNKICDIIPEVLVGMAIDVIVNPQRSILLKIGIQDPFNQLCFVGMLIAISWIFESITEYFSLISWRHLALVMQHQLRLQAYNRLQHADVSYVSSQKTGDMLQVVYDDINHFENFISKGPNEIIQLLVNTLTLGIIFFYVSPRLALITFIPIPIVMVLVFFFKRKLAQLYARSKAMSNLLANHMIHRLQGMTTIKSYVTQDYELHLLEKRSALYSKAQHDSHYFNALYIPIMRLVIMTGFITTLIYGGMLVLQGTVPISWYAVLVFLMQRLLWPLTTLTIIIDTYQQGISSLSKILQLLAYKVTLIKCTKSLIVDHIMGSVTFEHVFFEYQCETPVLKDINFNIKPKTLVAFVGTTGSGKSTIVNLLLRFYDPTSGSIFIDEKNIKIYDLSNLRQLIGLVSQDIYMVDGSVFDNIVYGSFDASYDDVIVAAKLAQAHDFILQLPQGYDTKIEELGKNLSGGQRQRIAIARALLKKSPILVFDEATSAVDNETQALLEKVIHDLKNQHTIIIIAHNLAVVRNANIIHVLDKGVIVESGSHEELLSNKGLYFRLYGLQ